MVYFISKTNFAIRWLILVCAICIPIEDLSSAPKAKLRLVFRKENVGARYTSVDGAKKIKLTGGYLFTVTKALPYNEFEGDIEFTFSRQSIENIATKSGQSVDKIPEKLVIHKQFASYDENQECPNINFSIIPASQNILNGKVLIPKTTAKLHKALLMESDKEARDEFCHWIGMKPFYGRVNMASVKAKIEHVNSLLSESK